MELVADYKYLHSTYLPNTIIKQAATHIHIQLVIVVNMYLHLQLHYIVCSIYPLHYNMSLRVVRMCIPFVMVYTYMYLLCAVTTRIRWI